jgi:hypothetical protein
VLASAAERAARAKRRGDVDILNYALTLEFLERDFFTRGTGSGLLAGRERALVGAIADHEHEHVSLLGSAVRDLGATPVRTPKVHYPKGVFSTRARWLATSAKLEALAVEAYHGQVTKIRSGDLLAAAAAIAGTESRHAAVTAALSGGNPFPAPVERSRSQTRVLRAARPFLGS